MFHTSFPSEILILLSIIFGASGIAHLAGPGFLRRVYERCEFPPGSYRTAGFVQLLTALFLVVPRTHAWGLTLAGFVTFIAVVILLGHRQYAWSVPGLLIMAALIPTALAVLI